MLVSRRDCLGFVLILLWSEAILGGDLTRLYGEEQSRIADFALARMKSSRNLLNSGIFNAEGTLSIQGGVRDVDDKVTIFSAFDFRKRLLRCDRTGPMLVPATLGNNRNPAVPARLVSQLVKTCYVSTPEGKLTSTSLDGSQVSFDEPGSKRNAMPYFDVRLVGLTSLDGVQHGHFDDLFPKLTEKLRPALLSAQKESETIYRLEWRTHGGLAKRSLWIDEAHGFSPIRLEVRADPKLHVDQVYRVEWMQVSKVWVPKTFSCEEHSSAGRIEKCTLRFTWRSVNQAVDASLFYGKRSKLAATPADVIDAQPAKPLR